MKKSTRGITLIDLLVVVAFISILAAIFIPRVATFAMRTYNAAALTDLRNAVAAQHVLFADHEGYGRSSSGSLPGVGGTGWGSEMMGPLLPGTTTVFGAMLTVGPAVGPPVRPIVGIGIPVSDGVTLRSETVDYGAGPLMGYGASYLIVAKHMLGDTAFAAETEAARTIYACRNSGFMWVGIPGLMMVTVPVPTASKPDLGAGLGYPVACGGSEISSWTPLL